MRALELMISWARLPLVWASWLWMGPEYIITMGINTYLLAIFWVFVQNGVIQYSFLERYLYDSLDISCVVEQHQCNEMWLQLNKDSSECEHWCPDRQVLSFTDMACQQCSSYEPYRDDRANSCIDFAHINYDFNLCSETNKCKVGEGSCQLNNDYCEDGLVCTYIYSTHL